MAMIECPKCGEKISDSSRSCKYCGFDGISSYLLNMEKQKDIVKRQQEIQMGIERDRQINEGIERRNLQAQQCVPKCPICGSTNLSKLSAIGKATKIGLFGIFGAGDLGKTWKCNNCSSRF